MKENPALPERKEVDTFHHLLKLFQEGLFKLAIFCRAKVPEPFLKLLSSPQVFIFFPPRRVLLFLFRLQPKRLTKLEDEEGKDEVLNFPWDLAS